MGRVDGKVALVTGGASGIGAACAKLLAAEGASVFVTDIDQAGGEVVTAAIAAAGGEAVFVPHDVTSEAAWEAVIGRVREASSGLHVLVNNAGIGIAASIVEMSLADWQRQQAINLDGVFLGVKHSIPLLNDSGGGSIINMSSLAGIKGSPGLAAYNATKGGVRLFTKGVALECAQNRWPIRVNSVHPGVIDTPIWTKVDPNELSGMETGDGANSVDVGTLAETAVPTGVLGRAEDIAQGVLFLASDDSAYMTGTELVIDGGMSAS